MKIQLSFKCTVWQDVTIECSMEDAQRLSTAVGKGVITDIDSIGMVINTDDNLEVATDYDSIEFMIPSENDEQCTVMMLTTPFESSNN